MQVKDHEPLNSSTDCHKISIYAIAILILKFNMVVLCSIGVYLTLFDCSIRISQFFWGDFCCKFYIVVGLLLLTSHTVYKYYVVFGSDSNFS